MHLDLARMLLPDKPLLEIFIRGTAIYLGLFALIRFLVKREAGSLGVTDLLVIVLIADAAQNGMAGEYRSVSDGLILVAVIVGWSYALDALAFKSPWWRKVLRPAAVQLVKDGRMVRRNLEREMITEEELIGEIRAHGVADLHTVRAAYIESDGMISVITVRGDASNRPKSSSRGAV
jgi:uncharacterized membrane protein YcaP (DUF421 family)